MMKHLKRLSALLIALAIFFTAIPASAFYEDDEAAISPKTINSDMPIRVLRRLTPL